jgi:hypothetical protein
MIVPAFEPGEEQLRQDFDLRLPVFVPAKEKMFPAVVNKGAVPVQTYECFACHSIPQGLIL